jgi:hypothetical protein
VRAARTVAGAICCLTVADLISTRDFAVCGIAFASQSIPCGPTAEAGTRIWIERYSIDWRVVSQSRREGPLGGSTMRSLILALAVSVLLSVAPAVVFGASVFLPDNEYLAADFAKRYGPGVVVSAVDVAGPGVEFTFSGIGSGGTGVSDNFPVNDVGQILPSHGNGDFSNFDGYRTRFTNRALGDVNISLYLNTGFTGPSGNPSNDSTNDTFWQSPWVTIAPGASQLILLDFNAAVPYNIGDNKLPHTQGTNGVVTAINAYDRTEVSNIGFQVADFNADLAGQSIVIDINVPEPSAISLLGSGLLLVLSFSLGGRRRRTPK